MRLEREIEAIRRPNSYVDNYRIRWEDEGAVAAMFPEDIERLKEYSTSVPTGVCDGKVWKARYDSGWALCQYVHVAGTGEWFIQRNLIREIGVLERRRLQAEDLLAELRAQCQCDGLGLQLGGWIGPTSRAPYPRPCVCSEPMTQRELQRRWVQYLLRPGATIPGAANFMPDDEPFTRWYERCWGVPF